MSDAGTPRARYASHFPVNTVLRDHVDDASGLRFLVVRGPFSFCAYVGVKEDHALAGLEEFQFECHWGITFQGPGTAGTVHEEGWYWWGWDYAHFTDHVDYEAHLPEDAPEELREALRQLTAVGERTGTGSLWGAPKRWTVDEVAEDALDVLMTVKEALQASERWARLAVPH